MKWERNCPNQAKQNQVLPFPLGLGAEALVAPGGANLQLAALPPVQSVSLQAGAPGGGHSQGWVRGVSQVAESHTSLARLLDFALRSVGGSCCV